MNESTRTRVSVTTQIVGVHSWPGAPSSHEWLRHPHAHTFHVTGHVDVTDPDRQVEFFTLRTHLDDALASIAAEAGERHPPSSAKHLGLVDFGTLSCEQIAERLLAKIPALQCATVGEDGKDSSSVARLRRAMPVARRDGDLRFITICGSTRFKEQTEAVIAELEHQNWAVLAVGSYMHADGLEFSDQHKTMLDDLHLRKIAVSDAIAVVNPDGYIGESTRREITHARLLGKPIQWLVMPSDAQDGDERIEFIYTYQEVRDACSV